MSSKTLVLAAGLAALASAAVAQSQPYNIRLEKSPKNATTCMGPDATMSRVQTVTVEGDVAVLKSNGGINDKAKMVSPGVYRTRWSLSGINFDIEFNNSAAPATLTVNEKQFGCSWSGKAG
jgi:hypothetical protein